MRAHQRLVGVEALGPAVEVPPVAQLVVGVEHQVGGVLGLLAGGVVQRHPGEEVDGLGVVVVVVGELGGPVGRLGGQLAVGAPAHVALVGLEELLPLGGHGHPLLRAGRWRRQRRQGLDRLLVGEERALEGVVEPLARPWRGLAAPRLLLLPSMAATSRATTRSYSSPASANLPRA